jgi:class 3 adenylate cyclase/CHASE2 domain-containing sensor protein
MRLTRREHTAAFERGGPALASLLAGVAAAAVAAAIGLADRLDAIAYDAETALVRAVSPTAADDVVVVGIDQRTIDSIAAPIALWHAELGTSLGAIARAAPRLIALDVVLPERSMTPFGSGLDVALLKGIVAARDGASSGVVLALQPDATGRLRPIYLPFLSAAGDAAAGAALYRIDADGAVRFFDPELSTFIAAAADRLGVRATAGYIDYTRGPRFGYVPLEEVLRRSRTEDAAWLTQKFAGKVVVVGSVLPQLDRRRQPVSLAGWEPVYVEPPATLIHAQALRTALAGGFIAEAPRAIGLVLLFAFALVGTMASTIARWLSLSLAIAASFAAAAAALRGGWNFPLAGAWIAGGCAAATRSAYDGWHFLRERNRLARLFSGYVSPQVFAGIVAGRLAPRGRGKLALLFADVRGFTTLTEHAAADDVLDLLNRYFGAVTPILHAHGASIDAFRGDGLNALFGAPEPHADAPGAAMRAARDMLAALEVLNGVLRAEGREPLQIGIGLAYGETVFGDVGSLDRRDFTAIGDAVNLAARLQDLTKTLDCPILLTDALARGLGKAERADLVDFGSQPIKGHSAVHIWGCRAFTADGRRTPATPVTPGPGRE